MTSHRFYKITGLLAFLLLCGPSLSISMYSGFGPGAPGFSSRVTSVANPDSTSNVTYVMDGFEVQHLYDVPLDQQGSWVSLTTLPDGSLIASDESSKGSYKILIGGDPDQPSVSVTRLVMPITGSFGMTWAFDHLYANVNGTGLYRLRDENGDGELNLMEFLGGPSYRGEHGNHSVLAIPDGEGLYFIAGNHTPPPVDLAKSSLANWEEDQLLPREWDARGHARGVLAPGGYFAKINPGATEWEMFSIGYRNQFDADLNEHGDLFTYDSDMEWDMGMPWYRPTRLMHVVSGSDYGWRSGSGKWPDYYEDSLPAMLNIGPGSPTGVEFGTGAAFPEKYQRALYAFDWTFGTIYAVHLTPQGATYRAEAEEFLSGSPLPVTDGTIGSDGALYFVTGGRNQDSQLYRVVYKGNEPVAAAAPRDLTPEHELRRSLEVFHGAEHPEALDTAWPHLSSSDRFIRHAARVAVEAQPVDQWAGRALHEENPTARIAALVALARNGSAEHRSPALQSTLEILSQELNAEQKLGSLRALALLFMRLGDATQDEQAEVAELLTGLLPDEDARVNSELIRLLVYLRDARVIEDALVLMQNEQENQQPDWSIALLERNEDYGGVIREMIENPPPVQELGYAFMLRTLREGWTIDQRRAYFTFINDAADRFGGLSYSGFLEDMRAEALRNSNPDEQDAVADITGISLTRELDFEISPPSGPGRNWTVDEAMRTLSGQLNNGSNRDFEQGRSAFFSSSCASCHRFDVYGGNIGPDLTSVSRRFSTRGLVEKIIHPDILISDQYSSSVVTLRDGSTVTGLALERGNNLEVYSSDPEAPPAIIPLNQVETVGHVDYSVMPAGLINPLGEDELRDLVAYILTSGNADHAFFKTEAELEEERKKEEAERENEHSGEVSEETQ